MIKIDLVVCSNKCIRVFVVELNHFKRVGECIKWELDTLSHSNKLIFLICNVVTREGGHRLYKFFELFVGLDIAYLDSRDLHIEHLSSIEESLFLFSLQPVEEEIFAWCA